MEIKLMNNDGEVLLESQTLDKTTIDTRKRKETNALGLTTYLYVTNYYDDSLIVEIEDAISKLIEEKFSGKAIFLSAECKELKMKAEL